MQCSTSSLYLASLSCECSPPRIVLTLG